MSNIKISALTSATTPLAGTEVLPIVQSGATVKVANNDLRPKQVQSNATSGILQITGPAAASTRIMTTPDANFTVARTDAAQSFTGDQTLSTGNLVQGTAAKGINFTANTGAAGKTSQLLNWYEEGTWTATLTADVTGPTTPVTSTGKYTRIGRLVTVSCAFNSVNTTGASGNILIGGLPFAVGTSENYGVAVSYSMSLAAIMSRSVTSSNYISIMSGTTSIASPITAGAGQYMLMQITYSI